MLPWQPILGKIGELPSFGTLAFQNGIEYRSSNLKVFNCNILVTLFPNLMKIGPVTPETAK